MAINITYNLPMEEFLIASTHLGPINHAPAGPLFYCDFGGIAKGVQIAITNGKIAIIRNSIADIAIKPIEKALYRMNM
jgi:hypothetical protein